MSTLDNAYAILIGVGADLPATVQDAQSLYDLISDPEIAGYKRENIFLLTEKEAIRNKILGAFDTVIEKTDEDSSVFLYYSGHGGTYTDNQLLSNKSVNPVLKPESENETHYFLQPNDMTGENFEQTWVKAEELKEKISQLKTRRLVFFLDCCHAEGMAKPGLSLDRTELKERLRNPEAIVHRVDDGKGISVLTACRAEEQSYIMPDAPNSLFTTCLLEALQGGERQHFEEPYVRMTDVINYVMKKVPERKPEQRPFVNLQMYDNFILSKLPQAKLTGVDTTSAPLEQGGQGKDSEIVTAFREDQGVNALIFVHGFSGEAHHTFGKIPAFLAEDPKMKGWDLFPLGYSENVQPELGKGIWASVEDINRIIDNLMSSLQYKYTHYKRIALVGHSLGGLVIQKALLQLSNDIRDKVSHVVLFGTPSKGITASENDKGLYDRWEELQEDGAFISELRQTWETTFSKEYPFLLKVVVGTEDTEVPIDSSLAPYATDHHVTVAGSHFGMVQPEVPEHDGYQLLVSALTNNTFHNQFTDEEQINLLLGDYAAVIQKLLPKKDQLRAKGLRNLLFALEGMDRQEEMVAILKEHPLCKDNSDWQGILGGRLKRMYLQDFSEEHGEQALNYYLAGYEIADAKKDHEQRYYLAINIAFMSLVFEEDKQMMRNYAQIALEAAEADSFDSLWKNATLGEAYIYLGDFEKAREKYELVANQAGIREKISIHTNAFMAYSTLMHTQDDDFIKFLKTSFLS